MNETWQRDPRVLWRRSGGTIVLAAPCHEDVVVLDGTAALTWMLLADPTDEAELVRTLAEHFGVARQEVRGQLVPFLGQLLVYGAVRGPRVASAGASRGRRTSDG